jgi:hypothetical protein
LQPLLLLLHCLLQGPKGAPPAPRGTIMSVDEALEGDAPDPWESITVLWDSNDSSADLENKVRAAALHAGGGLVTLLFLALLSC